MEFDRNKRHRLFRLTEAALILGIPAKTLSQWLVRRQWIVDAHPTRDDYRLSYSDLLRGMLINELGSRYGIPIGQANGQWQKPDSIESDSGEILDYPHLAGEEPKGGSAEMVSELIDGNMAAYMADDGQGNRRVKLADVLCISKTGESHYGLLEDQVEKLTKSLCTLVVRLDWAEEALDEKISAAEAKAGRELGSRIK